MGMVLHNTAWGHESSLDGLSGEAYYLAGSQMDSAGRCHEDCPCWWLGELGWKPGIWWLLTHWGQDKMAAISQTYSNAFSWMKMYEFLFKISLKFIPKVWINNVPALVQKMAWRQPGDKPLSEPVMVGWLTHICVTQPQWVNPQTAEMGHKIMNIS